MGFYERQEKEVVILAAAEHVFAAEGFVNAKMEAVAQKAGISKGSVYFYFQSKEDLYLAITHKAFEIVIQAYRRVLADSGGLPGRSKVLAIMQAYIGFAKQYSLYHEAIFNYMSLVRNVVENSAIGTKQQESLKQSIYFNRIKQIHNLPVAIVVAEIKEGVRDGSIGNQQNPQTIYVTLWAMLIGFAKLNITMGDQNQTIYHVNSNEWQAYLLELAERILREG